MRRLALLLSLIITIPAIALPFRYSYEWATGSTAQPCSAGSCTRAAPTLATEGLALAQVSGYRLKVCAAVGQTLSGAGTMQGWAYDADEGVWMRAPDLDQTINASDAGKRCRPFTDFLTSVRRDRVLFAASGVTVSGGAGLDVLLVAEMGS